MVAPGLGTYANPIVIGDDLAPLGSASNPFVIQVDEGWCQDEPDQRGSDADTEIMATPEFWETLATGHLAVPVKDDVALDSSSVSVPTRSLVCEDPEDSQPFERSTSNASQSEKELISTKQSFDAPRECPGFGAARRENVMSDHRGSKQSTMQGEASKIEEPKEDRNIPDISSMTRIAMPQIKCLGKTALTWDSSISAAIGDELAAIHDHMEHCRNADCRQAKAFFDRIQSPQNTLPSNSNRPKRIQGQSDEGRVTMRFYAPDFQKGATLPTNLLVNEVIIRTAFSPDIPCSLEIFTQDDILFGQGAVVVSSEGEDPKCFLTFSPKARQDDHGTNFRASRKKADGIVIFESVVPQRERGANWRHDFTGQVSVELYKRWPPLASDYEKQEVFFGSITLFIHSDGVDPKCFVTFSSGLSSADRKTHSPAGNVIREPSMTTDTFSRETADQADTSVGKNLQLSPHARSLKRQLPHDGIQSEPRQSERLAKTARA
ncbi:hypothetical protein PoHVEF18_003102 [Penicillium ochrochloron]